MLDRRTQVALTANTWINDTAMAMVLVFSTETVIKAIKG